MRVHLSVATVSAVIAVGAILGVSSQAIAKPKSIACADVKNAVRLPDTTISLSEELPAGANPAPVGTIPVPICRVVGVTAPAVKFEVWMPIDRLERQVPARR